MGENAADPVAETFAALESAFEHLVVAPIQSLIFLDLAFWDNDTGDAIQIPIVVAWLGFLAARSMYGKGITAPDQDPLFQKAPAFANASANKFWVDEFYQLVVVRPLWALARGLHRVVDASIIDGLVVVGTARLTAFVARVVSPFQNGDLSRYAALTAIAAAGLLLWAVAA